MKYIQGQNRSQTYLFPVTLDDAISKDNEVRLIDVFVDSLALVLSGLRIQVSMNRFNLPTIFFTTVSKIYLEPSDDGNELYQKIKWYMVFYNTRRPHQSLEYNIPEQVYGRAV